jgi:type IV fimbrial biogenesis protein FimT
MANPFSRFRQAGATLVEIMITLVIIGIVMALGIPSFSGWVQNSQIRTAGESLLSGIQLARAQAAAMNSNVCIEFLDNGGKLSTAGTSWAVYGPTPDPAAVWPDIRLIAVDCTVDPAGAGLIQSKAAAEGTRNVTVAPNTTAPAVKVNAIEFDGLGKVRAAHPGGALAGGQSVTIDLQNSTGTCVAAGGPMRCLQIWVSAAGQVRMCDPDPAVNVGDPRKC